jgi:type IV pilus assembly protein PilB
MSQRIRLGDLLVQAQLVTSEKVEEALARQKQTGRRLGETLIELGSVSEQEVAQVLSSQLSLPWANLRHIDFSRELLNLVSADLAEKWAVVPVYVRRMRKEGDTLFVALDDPLNEKALAEIAAHVSMPVKPMVASSSELRSAIRAYYGRELPKPAAPKPTAKMPSIAPVEIDIGDFFEEPVPAPAEEARPKSSRPKSMHPKSIHPKSLRPKPLKKKPAKKEGGARMIRLTLLDGTSVALPTPSEKAVEEETAEEQLTTRDLVRALMLQSRGEDVKDVLGDAKWETLVAALLVILVKKGLVADWEFVEAWQKTRKSA